jgi:hypothetical protein
MTKWTLLACLLGGLSTGCRSVSVGPIDFEPSEHRSATLDRNLVEKAALLKDWKGLHSHVTQVDGDRLNRSDKVYALYWKGAADYHLHHYQSAQASWTRAQSYGPSGEMAQMLSKAQGALSSYDEFGSATSSQSNGSWAIQYGIFSLKKSAEDLTRELSWGGTELQIDEMRHNGRKMWVVWSGPYTGTQAETKQSQLNSRKVQSMIKPISSIRP